ncbi:hypothetical protein Mboo_0214 [Methanoregula boonei 6A8]|uniref:Uncharacterized protein n=1 Tax=Methanoregula boonei (strain DSM 21154 / JCM 14090 / 6A8) TaxID=456442 RepID=A7I4S5_METB6|nr:hypothetical protein Mboo_0214 [Methanoregula boonei 6A8]
MESRKIFRSNVEKSKNSWREKWKMGVSSATNSLPRRKSCSRAWALGSKNLPFFGREIFQAGKFLGLNTGMPKISGTLKKFPHEPIRENHAIPFTPSLNREGP